MELNFFNITCFAYAFLALLTRVIMVFYREKWNKWELNKAYTKKKPLFPLLTGEKRHSQTTFLISVR